MLPRAYFAVCATLGLTQAAEAQALTSGYLVAPLSQADLSATVQAANVTSDASGKWSVTWARPFKSGAPVVMPLPINANALPIVCNVAIRTAAGASGQCWQSSGTTLGTTLTAIAGTVVNPFAQPAANAAIMVVGRDPTQ